MGSVTNSKNECHVISIIRSIRILWELVRRQLLLPQGNRDRAVRADAYIAVVQIPVGAVGGPWGYGGMVRKELVGPAADLAICG